MVGILGKKIGMTQIFADDGRRIVVTLIEVGPCYVLQVKNKDTDGYNAIQLGFGDKKETSANRAVLGRFKKLNLSPKGFVREIRISDDEHYEVGKVLSVDIFKNGDFVDVAGTSIGKGFQGGVKRWHWKGGPASHGSMSHRRPGSIGSSTNPSRVFRGHHLPGRMGGDRITVQNLKVIKVIPEQNLLVVKGAVPGCESNYLIIKKAKKKSS